MADRGFVEAVKRSLRKSGARVVDDDIKAGERVFSILKKALSESDIVVFVVPPHEGSGHWALAELGAAKALDKVVLAVLPDRTRFRNRNSLLSLFDYETVDATGLSESALAQRILDSAEVAVAA
ncbi:MAG: TIR domain-containing protein [Rhizobiales bacterium]|nr:TIR domain-containing protein [Hyphomicrobiales bacterium]